MSGSTQAAVVELLDVVEESVRTCHILKPGTGNSYCGLKPFAGNEHRAHDRQTCSSAGHQICAMCTFECERLRVGGSDD